MDVVRRIGGYDLLIATDQPCDIALEQTALAEVLQGRPSLEKKTLMGFLSSGDQYIPLSLNWELLDSCNLACPFCYIVGHSFTKVVRFAAIESHISDLVDEGILFCTLTGGEATIHPDFIQIYEYLKTRGVIVEVFTNGVAIDDTIIDLFRRLPPAEVEVSIYTLDDRRLGEVYGFRWPNGASRVLENVLKMRAAGINVTCKTFLSTVTREDIGEIAAWCSHHGIEHYSSSEITAAYDGADLSRYAVSRRDPALDSVRKKPAVCLPCRTKNYGSAINSAFQVYPCPAIRLPDCTYDLRELGVREALKRMKAFMRRFQDSEIQGRGGAGCASCIAFAKPVRDDAGDIVHFAQP